MIADAPTFDQLLPLLSLELGDVAELTGLLAGLTTESLLMQVERCARTSVCFRVSYFGVVLGHAELRQSSKGDLSWIFTQA